MKIRSSFVTNSSSSSYVCVACGNVEVGYDLCMSEAEMVECVNGHMLCDRHLGDFSEEDWQKACLEFIEDEITEINGHIDRYKDEEKDNSWRINCEEDLIKETKKIEVLRGIFKHIENDDLSEEYLESAKESKTCDEKLLPFLEKYDYIDLYKEYFNDDWRAYFPECLCPVCNKEIVLDGDALKFALKKLGITKAELDELYRLGE